MDAFVNNFQDFHKQCTARKVPNLVDGKFGKVSVWQHHPTQKSFFYKQIEDKHYTAIEAFVHNLMKHNRYFVKLFFSMHSLRGHLLIMDYVEDGDLFDLLQSEKRIREPELSLITYQLTDALQALHKHNIVHNDIKLENVLYTRYRQIYLCDYGLCKFVNTKSSYEGTVDYFCPEKLAKKPVDVGFDWWAVGVLLFEISTSKHPYKKYTDEIINMTTLHKRQIQHAIVFPIDFDNVFLKEFISVMLHYNVEERANTFSKIQQQTYWKSILHWKDH
uniref:Protein kinase-1 n=1 Tax=Lymantria dispar multicapsid nuclear polyhedrosis virus TaxID=10449 RepID=A0A1B1MQL5_NPVLD|nr:protein kinase-1 [Lymantria dispar multiple nucleopolyhedrovirus]